MIGFQQVCLYSSPHELIWHGRVSLPAELTGVSFVDAWGMVPVTAFPDLKYDMRQLYKVYPGSGTGEISITQDWKESGTASQTIDGYFEVAKTTVRRQSIINRFLTTAVAQNNQTVGLYYKTSDGGESIKGAYYQLKIGMEEYQVSDVVLSDACIDHAATVSWTVSAQTICEVQALNSAGAMVFETRLETKTTSLAIPAGKLPEGACRIRVQAGYDLANYVQFAGAGAQTKVAELQTTLWRIRPRIIALEPDAVPQNREQDIAVYWTSENQQTCRLRVLQEGREIWSRTGATETRFTIPAHTLQSGNAQLQLTVSYTPSWGGEGDAVSDTKTISFEAYGTPPQPVITTPGTVKTSFPLITWTVSDQYYFRLQILQNGAMVQDTGEVPSELAQFQIVTPLVNGQYVLRLTVRNVYNLYSPIAEKALQVSADAPQQPVVTCVCSQVNGSVSVQVHNASGQVSFDYCELLRRRPGEEWLRLARRNQTDFVYLDFTLASDVTYEYRARAVSQAAGYRDSEIVSTRVGVPGTQLFAPEDPAGMLVLRLQPNRSETPKKGVFLMNYAGVPAPVAECSEERYSTITASFFASKADADHLRTLYFDTAVLVYRDNRGRRLFGCISSEPQIKDDAYGWCSVSFTFTETQYREGL